MSFTTKQRIYVIKKLATEIFNMGATNGLFFLEEYVSSNLFDKIDEINTQVYNNFIYPHILKALQMLDNKRIYAMYQGLFPEDAKKEFLEKVKKTQYYLSTDKLVLFFSHSKDVQLILNIKHNLEKTGWIECFVAHEDINEGKEGWIEEIKKYLECCHCLVAFLSEDFKSSAYCEQELGFAVHRQIPIFPIKLDKQNNPYGFIHHIQATEFNTTRNINILSNKIEKWLLNKKENQKLSQIAYSKLHKTVDTLTNNFLNSSNKTMAESVLEQLIKLKSDQIEGYYINEIQKNWKQNNNIKKIQDIEKKMTEFFKNHSKDASDSNQKPFLTNKEQQNLEINLRELLNKKNILKDNTYF